MNVIISRTRKVCLFQLTLYWANLNSNIHTWSHKKYVDKDKANSYKPEEGDVIHIKGSCVAAFFAKIPKTDMRETD